MYYLNARYYDPAVGRFLSTDAILNPERKLTGYNLFSYCLGNPVNKTDRSGMASEDDLDGDPTDDNSPPATKEPLAGAAGIPQKAYNVFNFIRNHNGSPPKNYVGGGVYRNNGQNNSVILPSKYLPIREYDVNVHIKGVNRGKERLLIGYGSGVRVWYTNDHYLSVTMIAFYPEGMK